MEAPPVVGVPVSLLVAAVEGEPARLREWMVDEGILEDARAKRNADIKIVFETWVGMYWSGKGKRPQLTPDKRRILNARLQSFTADELVQSLRGAKFDEYYMSNGYTKIDNLFRNSSRVEKWLALYHERGGESNFRNEQEKQRLDRLRIEELGAKVRGGSHGLGDKALLIRMVREWAEAHGETYRWQTGEWA